MSTLSAVLRGSMVSSLSSGLNARSNESVSSNLDADCVGSARTSLRAALNGALRRLYVVVIDPAVRPNFVRRRIVHDAAVAWAQHQFRRVEINGYNDTSPTPAENQALSTKWAAAVAEVLVAEGVPRSVLVVRGLGRGLHLLEPASRKSSAPRNRVEIILK